MNSAYELFEKKYLSRTRKSRDMHGYANRYLAGGVAGNAAYRQPYPLYMKKAQGSRLWDIDGNEYIDTMCSAGAAILGHSPLPIIEAVRQNLQFGTITLVTNEAAVELAKKIVQYVPGMELIRFVNSGSEAVHLALRAARAYTGREKYAKCEGNYIGQIDNALISGSVFAGTENNPGPVAQSAGISSNVLKDVVVLPWNNAEAAVAIIKKSARELAAVLIEPVAGMYLGGIVAEKQFIKALRKVCDEEGIVLIYDEVITGFRLGLSGACSITEVIPDLRTLGKVIGGGFPIGAYGGRKEIMETVVAPAVKTIDTEGKLNEQRKIFQSGTFSGNPISMIAGLSMIKEVEKPGFYDRINEYGERLRKGLNREAHNSGISIQVAGVGSMFCAQFSEQPIKNIRDIAKIDKSTGAAFYMGLEANGIHCPPFHLGFTCGAHSDEDIKKILNVAKMVFDEIKKHRH